MSESGFTTPPPWQPGPRAARFSELLNRHFAGRGYELAQLETALADTGSAHAQKACVIHGGGGHGKTTLARQHASRQHGHFAAYLLLNGDSLDLLDDSLALLAGPEWLHLGLPDSAPVAARRDATLLFLMGQRPDCRLPRPWLLVIDNVDDPDFVPAIAELVRACTGGQILITSRVGHWPAYIRPVPLGVWEESEAVSFLTRRLEEGTGTVEEMKKLAQELGHLPLALEQAAAYLTEHAMGLAAYLALLPVARQELTAYKIDFRTDERAAVATTWVLSRERCHPLARFLLRLAAHFSPEPVPRSLFTDGERMKEILELQLDPPNPAPLPERDALLAACARPLGLEDALAELKRHSLLTLTPAHLALHRLLCFSERASVLESERRAWFHRALRLAQLWLPDDLQPSDVRSWDRWNPLAPHLESLLTEPAAQPLAEVAWTVWVLGGFGSHLRGRGLYERSVARLRQSLAVCEKIHGPEAEEISTALNDLHLVLYDLGQLKEAKELVMRALAISEKNLGADHEGVGIVLNNLAIILMDEKRFTEAEPHARRALDITEKHFGPEHEKVAYRLVNLGSLLLDTGRLDEAEEMLQRSLSIRKKTCGERHPDTASSLSWLARLRRAQKRPAEAVDLCRQALDILIETLTEEHPRTVKEKERLEGFKKELAAAK